MRKTCMQTWYNNWVVFKYQGVRSYCLYGIHILCQKKNIHHLFSLNILHIISELGNTILKPLDDCSALSSNSQERNHQLEAEQWRQREREEHIFLLALKHCLPQKAGPSQSSYANATNNLLFVKRRTSITSLASISFTSSVNLETQFWSPWMIARHCLATPKKGIIN